jgi:hypothetical protein
LPELLLGEELLLHPLHGRLARQPLADLGLLLLDEPGLGRRADPLDAPDLPGRLLLELLGRVLELLLAEVRPAPLGLLHQHLLERHVVLAGTGDLGVVGRLAGLVLVLGAKQLAHGAISLDRTCMGPS